MKINRCLNAILFLILLLMGSPWNSIYAKPVAEEAGRFVESEVSVLLLSMEAPFVGGKNAALEVASFCEALFQEKGELLDQNFSSLLKAQGGTYRILCHRQMVQVGVFLPESFVNLGDFANSFLQKFKSGWQTWSPASSPPTLDDQVYQRIATEWSPGKSNSQVSVFLKGPLKRHQEEIQGIVRQIQPRGEPPQARSAPEEIFNASFPPSLVCLAEWEGPESESLARAQFASELLGRAGLPAGVRKDILSLPGRSFLEVIATAPLHRVGEFQSLGEGIQRVITNFDSSESWFEFVNLRRHLTSHDRRDLYKGAFLEAWQDHFGADLSNLPASFPWNPPTRFHQWLCLPNADSHRFLCDVSQEPRVVAMKSASGTEVEISILIERRKTTTDPSNDLKESLTAFENMGIVVAQLSETEVLLQTHTELSGLANLLATLRSAFLESFLRAGGGSISASFPVVLNSPGLNWNVTIAAVGPFPPYKLLSSLRKGWPAFSGPPNVGEGHLKALSDALDIGTFTPELVQGRWQLYTSSDTSLARTLARYVSRGGNLRDLMDNVSPR